MKFIVLKFKFRTPLRLYPFSAAFAVASYKAQFPLFFAAGIQSMEECKTGITYLLVALN